MRPDPKTAASGSPTPSRSRVLRRRVWTLGRLLILFLALCITFFAFMFTAIQVTNKAREVKAPDLKGKTVPEADAIVKRLGLVLKLDPTPVPDPSVPTGRVVIQDPVPGFTLRRARAVKVRVSEGMRAALVPTVNGQPERTAELALEGARLPVLARAEIRSADYSAGTVIAQDPPPGARASGVRLLINRPEEGAVYVTPDLVGLPYSRAVNVLQKQFPFRIGNGGDMLQPNLPTGTIVQQFPTAGSQIRAQDTLTLWTSR